MGQHAVKRFVFVAIAVAVLFPWFSTSAALALGLFVAVVMGNPFVDRTQPLVTPLLQIAIVGLGAGMNLHTVLQAGAHGFAYTVAGIVFTLLMGEVVLRRLIHSRAETSFLITVGTAICGGSAIAAVSGALGAKERDVSVALATVFLLNSVALVLFPPLGHWVGLGEGQFGLWSALAIHDTSSVVGASMQYGQKALEVATTVKLARALWIVPLTLAVSAGWIGRRDHGRAKTAKKPWFILGFVAMAALFSYIGVIQPQGQVIYDLAKRLMVLTLFLIGSNLTLSAIRGVGLKPLVHGVTLWVCVSAASLLAILNGWVN